MFVIVFVLLSGDPVDVPGHNNYGHKIKGPPALTGNPYTMVGHHEQIRLFTLIQYFLNSVLGDLDDVFKFLLA